MIIFFSPSFLSWLSRSGLIILGFLFYHPPTFILWFIATYLKPIRFRVGEGRIVRWAQEDMGFFEDEEDVMVNGGVEEQIPLKRTRPQHRLFADYGSAR